MLVYTKVKHTHTFHKLCFSYKAQHYGGLMAHGQFERVSCQFTVT